MLVALTGGIGSGKSTIARELRARGYAVYDTDTEAKHLIVSNPVVRSQVEYLLGSDVFDGDTYLTRLVAKQIFHHPDLRLRLNAIVHPAVAFHLRHWAQEQGERPCFVESAILFESGLDALCDRIVVVDAPEEIRIRRVLMRDYRGDSSPANIAQIRQRIAAQSTAHPTETAQKSPAQTAPSHDPAADSSRPSPNRNVSPSAHRRDIPVLTLVNDGTIPVPRLVDTLLSSIL